MTVVPARKRLCPLLETSRTRPRGSMPAGPSFQAAIAAMASVMARGTGTPAVKVPIAAIPAVRWLKPCAWAPVTARSAPPARPS